MVTEQPPAAPVVVGDVVTVTSAILAHCAGTGVQVTDSTFRLVDGYFECEAAGEIRPRGTAPVPVHTVRAERAVRNRIEAANLAATRRRSSGATREVGALKERWELTRRRRAERHSAGGRSGAGQVAAHSRVAGSHVLQQSEGGPAVPDSARSVVPGAEVIEWYCSPYHQGSPFYPVIEYFNRVYHLGRESDSVMRLDRLITRLREDGIHEPEDQALFAAMLSIPAGERLPVLTLSPERLREKIQDAVLGWLNARSELVPVLFVVEDLHWVDPSCESLLAQFVERGGEARVLAVFTFRPEYEPPWKGKAIQTQVALNRLTRSQVAEMIRVQAGERRRISTGYRRSDRGTHRRCAAFRGRIHPLADGTRASRRGNRGRDPDDATRPPARTPRPDGEQ